MEFFNYFIKLVNQLENKEQKKAKKLYLIILIIPIGISIKENIKIIKKLSKDFMRKASFIDLNTI